MPSEAFSNLLEDLQLMTKEDCEECTIREIEDLCRNPVFHLLCDLCRRGSAPSDHGSRLHPGKS